MKFFATAVVVTLGIGLALPSLRQGKNPYQFAGLSNAKQIGLGMLMYMNDWDDLTPYAQSTKTVRMVIAPYIRNKDVWETHNPKGSEFLFNMSLAGVNEVDIKLPAETLMFYESKPWADGTRIVAYSDGHCKILGTDQWAVARKSLQVKIKRKAKPLPANYPKGQN